MVESATLNEKEAKKKNIVVKQVTGIPERKFTDDLCHSEVMEEDIHLEEETINFSESKKSIHIGQVSESTKLILDVGLSEIPHIEISPNIDSLNQCNNRDKNICDSIDLKEYLQSPREPIKTEKNKTFDEGNNQKLGIVFNTKTDLMDQKYAITSNKDLNINLN